MKAISFRILLPFVLLFTMTVVYSQTTVKIDKADGKQIELAKELGPPSEGMTRIIFTRQSSIVGAVVPHLVADRGDSIEYNAFVVQDELYADFDGNFDKARNVTQLYLKDTNGRFHLLQGGALPGDNLLTDKSEIIATNLKFSGIVTGKADFDVKHAGFWESTQPLTSNIRLTGVVKSGDTSGWDRNPGKVRIEVIVPNGDQAFCPAFNAEPGVTYFVDYYYMKASFKIAEHR